MVALSRLSLTEREALQDCLWASTVISIIIGKGS
jgi:hypothetical protein